MSNKASRFKRVCVFCGTYAGRRSVFQEKAINLGNELVKRKLDLVYGGGSAGLMGTVAWAIQERGQRVPGVMPEVLMRTEVIQITWLTVKEVKVVANMHERKAEMACLADVFIGLPGGYGMLDELMEVITWAQLGIHNKPVGVLNVDGFYDFLLDQVDKSVQEGFIQPNGRHIVVAAPTAQELLIRLEI